MQVSINPLKTTVAAGSFAVESNGFMQGNAMADPAVRYALAGGVLASDAALPLWGGCAIKELVPPSNTRGVLGGVIDRATALAEITGFSVFDQAYGMVNSPQSQVPLTPPEGQVNFYRLGSGARIAVKAAPSLIDLEGNIITSQVSWDYTYQQLGPYEAAHNTIAITSQTRDPDTGIVTVVTAAPHPFAIGDVATIVNAVPGAYNGPKDVLSAADNTHFTYMMAEDPGVSPAGTPGNIAAGGGALPCKILRVNVGNSLTVEYDPVTGFANWNRNGNAVLIQI